MGHAQTPDFVFRRNGLVHLTQRRRQFSRLLAAEWGVSAVVMLDTPCSEVVWRVLATQCIRQFPPSLPQPVRPSVPSPYNWSLPPKESCSDATQNKSNLSHLSFNLYGKLCLPSADCDCNGRKLSRICALFKAYSGERAWKPIGDRLQQPHYLSKVGHEKKIKSRRHKTDIEKYSLVNRTIRHWYQLPVEVLGTLPCKPITFKKRVRKVMNELN
jgi:hypothetical protein